MPLELCGDACVRWSCALASRCACAALLPAGPFACSRVPVPQGSQAHCVNGVAIRLAPQSSYKLALDGVLERLTGTDGSAAAARLA